MGSHKVFQMQWGKQLSPFISCISFHSLNFLHGPDPERLLDTCFIEDWYNSRWLSGITKLLCIWKLLKTHANIKPKLRTLLCVLLVH